MSFDTQDSYPTFVVGSRGSEIQLHPLSEARAYSAKTYEDLDTWVYGPRPDTISVLNGTLEQTGHVFDPDESYGYILVVFSECNDGNGGATNCSAACGNHATLFGSWYSLYQCLMLASLSTIETRFSGVDDEIIDAVEDALSTVQGFDASSFDGLGVIEATIECATVSCRKSGTCEVDLPRGEDSPQWLILSSELANVCEGQDTKINADIAGPGVLISYMIQSIVALVIWGFVRIFTLRTTWESTAKPFRFFNVKHGSHGRELRSNLSSIMSTVEKSRLGHATATFVVEFQEAQCYFVIGVAVALIIASTRMASIIISEDWQGLLTNRFIMVDLGLSALYPILLVQLMLNRIKLSSFYTLFLATVAIALAAAMVDSSIKSSPDEVYKLFKGQNPLPECGGQASLRSFCLEPTDFVQPLGYTGLDPFIMIPFLVICWIQKLAPVIKKTETYRHKRADFAARHPGLTKWGLAAAWPFGIVIMFLTELFTVGNTFYSVLGFQGASSLDWNEVGEWNVGQILAVLVFVPAASKYLHLIALGIEKGFRDRISPAFVVVRRSDVQDDQAGGNENDPENDRDNTSLLFTPLGGQSPKQGAILKGGTA